MKKLTIFCDGGLGNRLGVLIGGMLTSNKLKRMPILCWPENSWCGCSFTDLFHNEYELINLNINELFNQNKYNTFLIHENQTDLQINHCYPSLENVESLKNNNDENIIYYHNSLPDYYNQEQVLSILSIFRVKNEIKNILEEFCNQNVIDLKTFGIHLRKTDFINFINEEESFKYIESKPNVKFFICSDSSETEEKFLTLSNVFAYKKKYYVEKLKEGDWNDLIVDTEGRRFNFNVNRSRESVKEAFIDLLILSRTNIITQSHSSFLNFAKLYKNIPIKNL